MIIRYVEEMANTIPPGLEGWRLYRIVYGDTGAEGRVWMPPLMQPANVTHRQPGAHTLQQLAAATAWELKFCETLGDVAEVAEELCRIAGRPIPSGPTNNWDAADNWELAWKEYDDGLGDLHLSDIAAPFQSTSNPTSSGSS